MIVGRRKQLLELNVLGNLGDFISGIAVVVTLIYLAIQIRRNTAQQKREELLSIQNGQNNVIAQLLDPRIRGAFVRGSAGQNPTIEDLGTAQNFVLQYVNQFEIVHNLYKTGAMAEEQYQRWAGFAVSMVAPAHTRQWWDHEDGRLAFHPDVREAIERRLHDEANPPRPITEMWTTFSPEAWESSSSESSP